MPDRLSEQIMRNSIMRTLEANLDFESHQTWGVDEYFEMWGDGAFPWIEGGTLTLHPNSALSHDERQALSPLVAALNDAWSKTDGLSLEEFLATDWPDRITSLASQAFVVMAARGRFSEEAVEAEPSGHLAQ